MLVNKGRTQLGNEGGERYVRCGHEASCGYASDILYQCLMPKINSHQYLLILKEKENIFPCYAMEINSIFCVP